MIRSHFVLLLNILIHFLNLLSFKYLFNRSQIIGLALTRQLILYRIDLSKLRALPHPILLRFATLLILPKIISKRNIIAANL